MFKISITPQIILKYNILNPKFGIFSKKFSAKRKTFSDQLEFGGRELGLLVVPCYFAMMPLALAVISCEVVWPIEQAAVRLSSAI